MKACKMAHARLTIKDTECLSQHIQEWATYDWDQSNVVYTYVLDIENEQLHIEVNI